MRLPLWQILALVVLAATVAGFAAVNTTSPVPADREEVIFWHFWGGQDRPVVEGIVERFNQSQDQYYVRAIAMPGNNLDLKFFLAVTGGDPPDLVNQDDPIVADWAHRGALTPIRELASEGEYERLQSWLLPPARALGSYREELYALCNGLDIRALYYDKTVLDEHGLEPPETIEQLDRLAEKIAPAHSTDARKRFGYLPDPRRLWAWGIVFNGQFYDPVNRTVTSDSEPIIEALDWMTSYSRRYGADQVTAFRKGDQGLTGASFPLLQERYVALMDGQWRVREIAAYQQAARAAGKTPHEFGVAPLPSPPGGRNQAGWVNGNFFVVPRGAKCSAGAWAFMKFWSGFDGNEPQAAQACAEGGWIPASQQVIRQSEFQEYLGRYPLFLKFVDLAGSEHQVPTPAVPVASFFYSEIVRAAEDAMYRGSEPREALEAATVRIQARLDAVDPSAAGASRP